jgi:hypothetical protein
MNAAAGQLGLPEGDLRKALKTVELAAILKDPITRTKEISPEKAMELYNLQRVVARHDTLGFHIRWERDAVSPRRGSETIESDPLHDALAAALDLLGYRVASRENPETASLHSLWYQLALVGATDAGLLDENRVEDESEHRRTRHKALRAYEAAKASTNLLTVGAK